MARMNDWLKDRLPATRLDTRLLWTYVLDQTEHITALGKRVQELEEQADKDNDPPG